MEKTEAPRAYPNLRETFLVPFEQIVKRTNIRSIMPSYNEIDGVPSHANSWLLNGILRGEWGFKGMVVSDYAGVRRLRDQHFVVPDYGEAAVTALRSGVDVEMPQPVAFALLPELVQQGRIDETEIDRAVRRILTVKFLAGLFENPYADPDHAEAIIGNDEARALAREAAQRSAVLLRNEGVLPFDASELQTLAIVGPNAAETVLGGYSDVPRQTISLLDGVRAKVGQRVNVLYAEGVSITEGRSWWGPGVTFPNPSENRRRITEAVDVARDADAIVIAVGGNESTAREAFSPNHLGDRSDLDLLGQQNELVAALLDLEKPTVVVLINGRPLAATYVAENAPAILEAWYLGQETGTALADILFGDVSPGGKLPVTIPRSVGQLPMFYNHKPSARSQAYLTLENTPLYPFGYGLSYTSFQLGSPRLSASAISPEESVQVSVDIRNTGTVEGDEVIQLYLRDEVSSVARPVKELKGFERVTLGPGQTTTVTFELTPQSLAFFDRDMRRIVEPGIFRVMTGPNSDELQGADLEVVGNASYLP